MPVDVVPAPGSPTVPPLAGWEAVGMALLAVLAVALLFLAIGALATGRRRRSPEWEAWLDGRSRSRIDAEEPAVPPAGNAPAGNAPARASGPPGPHLGR